MVSRENRMMSRRGFAALAGGTAASLLAGGQAVQAEADAPADRPNVLVFFTDQQRWDTCGCYPHSAPGLTPNLDRMAKRGTVAMRSFTCQPVCAPARGCFQTGLYATQHGVWRNGIALPQDKKTLAGYFKDAGYYTGYIGKWHLGDVTDRPVPVEQRGGYEYWLAGDAIEITSHPYDFRLFDGDGKEVRRPGYRVDAQTDCVLEFLQTRSTDPKRPFFLFASYLEPHHQNDLNRFVAPEGYAEPYRENSWIPPDLAGVEKGDWKQQLPDYLGMVKRLDENLGRVLSELKRLGLDKNTVVMFCSDHGCHFRTRNSEYKRSCHEDAIHVPTVFQGPGFDSKRKLNQLISIPDWTATLLEVAGITKPPALPGHSILPLVRGEATDWQNEVFVQISESEVARAIRTDRWKYCVQAPGKKGYADSGSDHYQEQYLYDLQHDPAERSNLVGRPEYRKISDELRATLKRRMIAAGESEPVIE